MIAIDTNVLLRYLVEDEPEEAVAARRFFETELSAERRGFISLIVVCELVWVLSRTYRLPPATVRQMVGELLVTRQLYVENAAMVEQSIASATDIPDYLIAGVAAQHGCSHTVTFDRRFARMEGVERLH